MTVHDPFLEKRARYLARRKAAYAANQLPRLNAMRAHRGKPPYRDIAEIGTDLIRTASLRERDEKGRFR